MQERYPTRGYMQISDIVDYNLGILYWEKGLYSRAIDALERIQRNESAATSTRRILADSYFRVGRLQEALAAYSRIVEGSASDMRGLVRYRMRALGFHKIGIRAVATAGRAGYTYSDGDQFALIIRNFSVNPSGEYVDVPWNSTEDMGYCTQACNFNISEVRFSELEYHVPIGSRRVGRTT